MRCSCSRSIKPLARSPSRRLISTMATSAVRSARSRSASAMLAAGPATSAPNTRSSRFMALPSCQESSTNRIRAPFSSNNPDAFGWSPIDPVWDPGAMASVSEPIFIGAISVIVGTSVQRVVSALGIYSGSSLVDIVARSSPLCSHSWEMPAATLGLAY
jgi:hypothetical protein